MGSPWLALFSGCYPGRPGLHPRANVGPGDAPRNGRRSEPRPKERETETEKERGRQVRGANPHPRDRGSRRRSSIPVPTRRQIPASTVVLEGGRRKRERKTNTQANGKQVSKKGGRRGRERERERKKKKENGSPPLPGKRKKGNTPTSQKHPLLPRLSQKTFQEA